MTNAEKFTTAEERARAFDRFCEARFGDFDGCSKCELKTMHLATTTGSVCPIAWLDLEAEDEKQLPCPFCGGTDVVIQDVGGFELACLGCGFHTPSYMDTEKLISEYQRVARAVIESGKKEETP